MSAILMLIEAVVDRTYTPISRTVWKFALRWCSCYRVCCAFAVVLCVTASRAPGRELLVDSSFELNADEWISAVEGIPPGFPAEGDWFVDTVGSATPLSSLPTSDRGGGDGNYAVSDQTEPTKGVLLQEFTVPPGARSIILSYDMFVNDWSSQPAFHPRKHARADLIQADAPRFNTTDGIVANFYLGTDGGPLPNPFTHYEFDIAPFVSPGEKYAIRFYEINNFDRSEILDPNRDSRELNVGVDNVSVFAVPEPSARAIAILAFTSMLCLKLWMNSTCSPVQRSKCGDSQHQVGKSFLEI